MIRKSIACLSLICLVAFAAPARSQDESDAQAAPLRLSLSYAVATGTGSMLAAGRYGKDWGARLGFWLRDKRVDGEAPNVFAGVDHLWTYRRWRFGLGVVWLDKINHINGTYWNFSTAFAYDVSDRIFIEVLHFSHGSSLGIKEDLPNKGWDFIGLGVAW